MVGPIDYTMQVLDPIQGYLQGLQFGENIQTARLGREQTRQSMGIQAAQEARAAEAFRMQKAEAANKLAEARRSQQALLDLFNNPSPTSDDFTRAYLANPAIRDEVKFLMDKQTSEQNKALLTSSQNIYAAAAQQNPDVLRRILTEQRDAMSAAGNEQMVRLVDEGLKMLDTDPAGAMQQLRATTGLTILGLGGDVKKINEALGIGAGVDWRPATPAEASAYGAKFGQVNVKTGEFKAAKEPLVQNIIGDTEGTLAKELAKGQAATLTSAVDAGIAASRNLAELDQLEKVLSQSKTGAGAAVKSYLGSFGIETEGLSLIQAAEAAINRMVPAQRQPGSGTMSDRDLELFKKSLPAIINTPGGNELIIETVRAINEYDVARSIIAGKISDWVATPKEDRAALEEQGIILSPSEGRKAMMDIPNPLSSFRTTPPKPSEAAAGITKEEFFKDPKLEGMDDAMKNKVWENYKKLMGIE